MLWIKEQRWPVLLATLLGITHPTVALAQSGSFNARSVMERMTTDQRYQYLSGVIDGLAHARFLADGKSPEGMNCIQHWFYGDARTTTSKIYEAFDQYPEHVPAAIIAVLFKRKCGG